MKHALTRALLVGNPNAGKSTLFNRLTGATRNVGNYPGITVDAGTSRMRGPHGALEFVDVPGCYSLAVSSPDEAIALEHIARALAHGSNERIVFIVVLDSTTLRRGLYFASQILSLQQPTLVVLNMQDEAIRRSLEIEVPELAGRLGAPVIAISARDAATDVRAVLASIEEALAEHREHPEPKHTPTTQAAIDRIARLLVGARKPLAPMLLLSEGIPDGIADDPATSAAIANELALLREEDSALPRALIAARYELVDELVTRASAAQAQSKLSEQRSARIDRVLTHPVWGTLVFAATLLALFETLFRLAEPLTTLVDAPLGWVRDYARGTLPGGALKNLFVDGLLLGVANVVTFVPQLSLLFLALALLEDSGYLARAAALLDRVFVRVGLPSRAAIPLISGLACAVPAILATRTLSSRRDRLLTMAVVPLMSCSARLPIYTLVVALIFPPGASCLGISLGAWTLLALYFLSTAMALLAAFVLGRTALRGKPAALVLELPPYRWPGVGSLVTRAGRSVRGFVTEAGKTIVLLTIVLWAGLSYPKLVPDTSLDENAQSSAQLANSAVGRTGHFIEPAIAPLGFDWQIGVGILGAFSAREVLISTLGVAYGLGETDEESASLRDTLRRAKRRDGSKLFTPLTGFSLMIFFMLAAQCMSTLAIIRRESGSWRWPAAIFVYMTTLAYLASLLVYQGGKLLGLQ